MLAITSDRRPGLRHRLLCALALAITFLGGTLARAQQPLPDDGDVTQLSVTLVRVDAVVTDEKGNLVTDLEARDFEVFEDGKPQEITGFSFVSTVSGAAGDRPATGTGAAPSAPTGAPTAARGKRTIAFVVDDLFISAENYPKIKHAMREFVNARMQPGDLVAIIRTSGDSAVLQQFSADKREVHAAIDRLHWNSRGFKGASTFSPPDESVLNNRPAFGGGRPQGRRFESYRLEQAKRLSDAAERQRAQRLAVVMLGTLGETVESLDELPGRKSVVLFSEGFRVLSNEFVRNYDSGEGSRELNLDAYANVASGAGDSGLLGFLRQVVDRANRAAVSIYAIDPRGITDPSFASAQNSTLVLDRDQRDRLLGQQRDEYLAASTALHFLADKTGGEVTSSNDPGFGIRRAIDDLAGYYAIDYIPEETFASKDKPVFHELSVRVKRPGLRVRARSGFYGVTDAALGTGRTLADRVAHALASPLGSTEVLVRVSAQCVSAETEKPTIRAVVHADVEGLTLADAADGGRQTTINVVAVALAADGAVVAKAEKTHTLHLSAANLERARAEGLTFVVNLPASRPGTYRVRAAVRDAASDRIGSAGHFVEVPDVAKGELVVSSAVLGSESGRFRPGAELQYGFVVYNAKIGRGRPDLAMQFAIWQEGRELFRSPLQPLDLKPQPSWRVIHVGGGFGIRERMRPGRYQLQLTVVDKLAGDAAATEWVDFEVVPAQVESR